MSNLGAFCLLSTRRFALNLWKEDRERPIEGLFCWHLAVYGHKDNFSWAYDRNFRPYFRSYFALFGY